MPQSTPSGSLACGEIQASAIAVSVHFESDGNFLDEPMISRATAGIRRSHRLVCETRHSGGACTFTAHDSHHASPPVDRMVVMRHGDSAADEPGPGTSGIRNAEDTITGKELPA